MGGRVPVSRSITRTHADEIPKFARARRCNALCHSGSTGQSDPAGPDSARRSRRRCAPDRGGFGDSAQRVRSPDRARRLDRDDRARAPDHGATGRRNPGVRVSRGIDAVRRPGIGTIAIAAQFLDATSCGERHQRRDGQGAQSIAGLTATRSDVRDAQLLTTPEDCHGAGSHEEPAPFRFSPIPHLDR
jgi:hypothetical protein